MNVNDQRMGTYIDENVKCNQWYHGDPFHTNLAFPIFPNRKAAVGRRQSGPFNKMRGIQVKVQDNDNKVGNCNRISFI